MEHGSAYEASIAPVKRQLFSQLPKSAHILDAGIGTGPNLQYLAQKDASVIGLDPNPAMFPYARRRAESLDIPDDRLTLREGFLEQMPFEADTFDCVLCTITLCSVASQQAALQEVQRVLKPGGSFFFIEHVQAFQPGLQRTAQSVLQPLQRALADGCHLTRRTGDAIEAAGFAAVNMQQLELDGGSLIAPHIWGSAVMPIA